jgi:hypothetical protein
MKNKLILLLLLLLSTTASAQQLVKKTVVAPCVANSNSPDETSWRWPNNSRISVYVLRQNFAAPEINSIRRAIDNWNLILTNIAVNVQFVFAGETDSRPGGEANVTVNRGSTYHNHRHLAEMYPVFESTDYLGSALITIDRAVCDSETLTSVLTHELGHSLGMNDCPKCRRGATIMALYRGPNENNDMAGPSACDSSVVAHGYKYAAPPVTKLKVVSEGIAGNEKNR